MLDGYVAAIVAGPESMSPPDWICSPLALDADAFNHGGTLKFAAISTVALHHNDISTVLSTATHRFAPALPSAYPYKPDLVLLAEGAAKLPPRKSRQHAPEPNPVPSTRKTTFSRT
ncbi:UPF0149 family protein [Bradyrhizobium sp. UFLA05-109]